MDTSPIISIQVAEAFTATALRGKINSSGKLAVARACDAWIGTTPYGLYDETTSGRDMAAVQLKRMGKINVRPTAAVITAGDTIGGAAGGKVQKSGFSTPVVMTAATTDLLTATAHGLSEGDRVQFTTNNTLPAGLSPLTDYYVKTVPSSSTFTVSATLDGATVDITDTGTGAHAVKKSTAAELIALQSFAPGFGGTIEAVFA
jgi:hypothetical protein